MKPEVLIPIVDFATAKYPNINIPLVSIRSAIEGGDPKKRKKKKALLTRRVVERGGKELVAVEEEQFKFWAAHIYSKRG